ncbi:MAG: endonuclease/exonuclease/phosphatase family protein [Planctomycetota bacterium]
MLQLRRILCVAALLIAALLVGAGCEPGAAPLPAGSTSAAGAAPAAEAAPLGAEFTPLHAVQGAAHLSPLAGRRVQVQGVVTAVAKFGFWLQAQDGSEDGRDETSEAVFVRTGSAAVYDIAQPSGAGERVQFGDLLSLSGVVTEHTQPERDDELSVTELHEVQALRRLGTSQAVPQAVRLGLKGRLPPDRVIADDGDVREGALFDPAQDGLDFLESLEGMLVEIPEAVAIAPTNGFGELWVLGNRGTLASGRSARGGLTLRSHDQNPERLLLDDLLAKTPRVDVGSLLEDPAVGPLDYAFGAYRVQIRSSVRALGGVVRERARPARDEELSLATFNVKNLAADVEARRLRELALIIVEALGMPDLVALQEIQDDSGAVDDGTVSSERTAQRLLGALAAAGAAGYHYVDVPPQDQADGGQPGGNIRVGLLWREERGLQLLATPQRLLPEHPAFAGARKPLVAELSWRGQPLTVIVNHWSSKIGDEPAFGLRQPPSRPTEAGRVAQARVVRAEVERRLAADRGARLVVLGDLNDTGFSAPVAELLAAGLVDAALTLPPEERYSYIFQGQSEQLDHILLSPALAGPEGAPHFEFRFVHLNAEFVNQASDHDPALVRLVLR